MGLNKGHYADDDRHTQTAYKRNKGRLIELNPYSDLDEFPDESSLFIGDLSRTVNEEMLMNIFLSVGPVESVDIKRDKVTKNNLGYGFVKFGSREQAEAAKAKMNGLEIGGRAIRIGWAQKNTNLFVCLVGDVEERINGLSSAPSNHSVRRPELIDGGIERRRYRIDNGSPARSSRGIFVPGIVQPEIGIPELPGQ